MESGDSKKKWLSLLVLVGVGIAFIIPGITLYRKAFPESSIDFRISRGEALEKGEAFLQGMGIDCSEYLRTIEFDYDLSAKIFLEMEEGLEKADEVVRRGIRIWRWKARWFKPHQQEEYQVNISPEGDISGFRRIIPEDAERENSTPDEALKRAEGFLDEKMKVKLGDYSIIEEDFTRLQKRTDHRFVWQKEGFEEAGATYRIAVTIQGKEVGSYHEFLNIPEEWQRQYARMNARNNLLQNIVFFCTIPFLFLIPITVLVRMRRHDVRWRFGAFLAATLFILYMLQGINSIPIYLSGFDTSQSLGSFSGRLFLQTLVEALLYGVLVFIIAGASEPLYREQFPQRLSMAKLLSFQFFRTREFFSATVAGYALTLIHVGYVVLFYLLGKRAGVWSPADVGYSDALSTFLPWIYPLTASLTASLLEELVFRVFAISLLRKFFPTWIAVLLPALLWGFLHSNYPQQPFYIRGIEVSIIGIIAGYVFLRWGVFATLVWHYSIDAFLIGLFLFGSSNLYFIFSGILVVGLLLIPLLLSLGSLARKGILSEETGLRNVDEARREELPVQWDGRIRTRQFSYTPLSGGKQILILLCALLSLVVIASVRVHHPWGDLHTCITPRHAEATARDYLQREGFDQVFSKSVVTFINATGSDEDRYIQNTEGWRGLEKAYSLFKDCCIWGVRFFAPMSWEELSVSMNGEGRVISFSHIIPENREAPATTSAEAMGIAEEFLRKKELLPIEEYLLVDVYQDKKPNRIDHTFTWKWEKEAPGNGEYRISVDVSGAKIAGFEKHIRIPEEWKVENEREDITDILILIINVILIATAGGFAVAIFVRDFISRSIDWKYVLFIPMLSLSFIAIRDLNSLPTILEGYRTNVPLSSFLVTQFMLMILRAGGMFIAICISSVAMFSLQRECEPEKSMIPSGERSISGFYRDTILSAASFTMISLAFIRMYRWLDAAIDIPRSRIDGALIPGMDTFLPSLDVVSTGAIRASFLTPVLYFGYFFFRRYLKKRILFFLLSVPIIAVFVLNNVKGVEEFIFLFSVTVTAVFAGFVFLDQYARDTIFASFIAFFLLVSMRGGWALLIQSDPFFRINGIFALVLMLALPVVIIITMRKKKVKRENE